MKRLLMLPLLLLGLSFACDQPHEEVAGVKIGCPLNKNIEYKEVMDLYEGKIGYRELSKDSFFEIEGTFYRDGVIEGVTLGTGDKDVNQSDYTLMIESMEDRWGKPLLQEDGETSIALFTNNRSDIIKMVAASFSKPSGPLVVVYRDQKSLDSELAEIEKENALRKERFKGL